MSALLQLAVGLGIFLFGMSLLEGGAKELSGRRLKNWILKSTASPVSSALLGTVFTAILQSSSLVGLVVLAFASAGAIPLINAVGVLLGANLGTTFTGWLVTTVGFKLDLEQAALPMIALAGVSQIFWQPPARLHAVGKVFLGLGLLLFGLSVMKVSVADIPNALNFSTLQGFHPFIYLLIGTAITAVIQSSSAMMILTLTALNAGLVTLPEAAALVIGADLGTTSTVLLGSITGGTVKRQLALAHLLFNVFVDVVAFFVFLPLVPTLFAAINFKDPLYGLVAFHSLFNLAGLIVFVPIIHPFTNWITRLIKTPEEEKPLLENLPIIVPETAVPLLHQALLRLWGRALITNAKLFAIKAKQFDLSPEIQAQLPPHSFTQQNYFENYAELKENEGEILQFVARAQQLPLTNEQSDDLNQVVQIARAIVYGAKTLKDIVANLQTLQAEADYTHDQFKTQREYHLMLYNKLLNLVYGRHNAEFLLEECEDLTFKNDQHQGVMDRRIYQNAHSNNEAPSFLSTQLNVNREVHHAAKSLLNGLKGWTKLKLF